MKTIETTAVVTTNHVLTINVPSDVVPGEHRVVVVIDEIPETIEPHTTELPTHDLGPWPAGLSLRREDMYDDWGR